MDKESEKIFDSLAGKDISNLTFEIGSNVGAFVVSFKCGSNLYEMAYWHTKNPQIFHNMNEINKDKITRLKLLTVKRPIKYIVIATRLGCDIIHSEHETFETAKHMIELIEKEYIQGDLNHGLIMPRIQPIPRHISKSDPPAETSKLFMDDFFPEVQPGFVYYKDRNLYIREDVNGPVEKKHKKEDE